MLLLTKEQEELLIHSLIESGEIELRSEQKTGKGRKIGKFFTYETPTGRRYLRFDFAQFFRNEMRDLLK